MTNLGRWFFSHLLCILKRKREVVGVSGGRDRDDKRLAELILYISRKSEGNQRFGATKLNKLLFYSDFSAYAQLGKSITGHEYQRLKRGPAPKHLLPVRDQLVKEKRLTVIPRDYHGQTQDLTIALDAPDLSMFAGDEIALVDDIMAACWGLNATEISCRSHEFIGWRLANNKEFIPYEVALVACREPTLDEIKRGEELEELAQEVLTRP